MSGYLEFTKTPSTDSSLCLFSADIREYIGEPFCMVLQFASAHEPLALDKWLGKPLGFRVSPARQVARDFHGLIDAICCQGVNRQGQSLYQATLIPEFYNQQYHIDSRVFQQMSLVDAFDTVWREQGHRPPEWFIGESYPIEEAIALCNEDYWSFFHQHFTAAGISYYFTHQAKHHTLCLIDAASRQRVLADALSITSQSSDKPHIRQWQPSYTSHADYFSVDRHDVQHDITVHSDYRVANPTGKPLAINPKQRFYGGHDFTQEAVDKTTQRIAHTHQWQARTIQAESNALSLMPNAYLRVLHTSCSKRPYHLLGVEHRVRDFSAFHLTDTPKEVQHYSNTFVCVDSTTPYSCPLVSSVDAMIAFQHRVTQEHRQQRTYYRQGHVQVAPRFIDEGFHLGPGTVPRAKKVAPTIIHALDVSCRHRRSIGHGNTLDIVATPHLTTTTQIKVLGFTVAMSQRYGGQEQLTGNVSAQAGHEQEVDVTVQRQPQPKQWHQTTEHTQTLDTVASPGGYWHIDTTPDIYFVQARDNHGDMKEVKVRAYPSDTYDISIQREAWESSSVSMIARITDWFADAFGIGIQKDIIPTEGQLSLRWGWQESDDHRAYHHIQAEASLKPLFGFRFGINISMAQLIGTRAGIPPVISDIIARHLADVIVYGKTHAELALLGNLTHKHFSDNETQQHGSIAATMEGSLSLGLIGQMGSDYVFKATANIEGSTTLTAKGALNIHRGGIELAPTITLNPLTVNVLIKFKALTGLIERTREGEWDVFDEIELYDDKISLLSRNTS